MNNCDGCQRGLTLKDGDHYDHTGRIVMGCTKARYETNWKENGIKELHELTAQIEACIFDIARTGSDASRSAKDNLSRQFNDKIRDLLVKAQGEAQRDAVKKIEEHMPPAWFPGGALYQKGKWLSFAIQLIRGH